MYVCETVVNVHKSVVTRNVGGGVSFQGKGGPFGDTVVDISRSC